MSERMTHLVQQLFNKPSLNDCTVQEIEKLTQQYPFFNTAYWLLLQKQPDENTVHKSALHVKNPLLFQQLMQDDEVAEGEVFENPMPVETFDTLTQESVSTDIVPAHVFENPMPPAPETEVVATPVAEVVETPINIPQPVAQNNTTNHEPLAFEPFHTVDYFASQGIKLSVQEVSNDNLGKQLKSFTEWLKTMKRLPATAITQNTDSPGEKKVENLAAHSLQNPDVITESMAEVWIKQGNADKAIAVYNKLSLQNPAKSAYFAAKIESLKKPD